MERPRGKLYTSNPKGLKNLKFETEVWQITRGGALISGAILVNGLAPSNKLFVRYLNNWKHLHPEQWWFEYEKQFLQELQSDEKLDNLRLLYKTLKAGKNVVLLCFCKDAKYCHRRLIGEYFNKYGIETMELSSIEPDISKHRQLTLYNGVI